MGSKQRRKLKKAEGYTSVVPTKEPEAVMSARPRPAIIGGSEEFLELRKLLSKKRPEGPSEKRARFNELLKAYNDKELSMKLTTKFALLEAKRKQFKSGGGSDYTNYVFLENLRGERWRNLAKEIRIMETDLSLYRRLRAQLEFCAPNKIVGNEIKKVKNRLWARVHEKLDNFFTSSEFLRAELRGAGLSENDMNFVCGQVDESLKPESEKPQYIRAGTGNKGRARALEIAQILIEYPQFLLSRETVSVASYREANGDETWVVGICSSKPCEDAGVSSRGSLLRAAPEGASASYIDKLLGGARKPPAPKGKKRKPSGKKKPLRKSKPEEVIVLQPDRMPSARGGLQLDSGETPTPAKKKGAKAAKKKGKGSKPAKKAPKQEEKKQPVSLSSDPLRGFDIDGKKVPDSDAGDFLGLDSSDAGVPKEKAPKKKRRKRKSGK